MASAKDPIPSLRSVLSALKSGHGRERGIQPKWKEETGELTAEDYPSLDILSQRSRHAAATAEGEDRGSGGPADDLVRMVRQGEIRRLEGDRMEQVFRSLLGDGLQDVFLEAADRIRRNLESRAPDDRRWALEGVRALAALEDLAARVPCGILSLMLDSVGRELVKEERAELQDAALDATAMLLGLEAVQGDLEGIHAHLAWLERAARSRGTEYTTRILGSRQILLPALSHYFREKDGVLESRLMPFLRFVGAPVARTLMTLLDEDEDRRHRVQILELLKRLSPLSLPALLEGLVGGSWRQIRNALDVVGELEEGQAFEYVVPCLEHTDDRVVHAAVRALWKTGGARAERYLLELLPRASAGTQSEVLHGLAQIGAATSVPVVARLAEEGGDVLRIQALDTLGRLKRPEAIPFLEERIRRKGRIFKSAEPMPVRLAAARALLAIGTLDARRVLDRVVQEEPKGPDQESLRRTASGLSGWG